MTQLEGRVLDDLLISDPDARAYLQEAHLDDIQCFKDKLEIDYKHEKRPLDSE